MSIDAVAVLHIAGLAEPTTPLGISHPVEHRGDASLVNLMQRFDGADLDEHALALRRLVGAALDGHADPRGILFFADVKYPRAMSYDAIVSEKSADGGAWAPKVAADYVPLRYRGTPRKPHDGLVGEMIAIMGRDAGLELDMVAYVNGALLTSAPDRQDAVEAYRKRLKVVTETMGAEFSLRYEASLRKEIEAMRESMARPMRLDWDDESKGEGADAYADAPPGTHEALVAEMIKVMGREVALHANMTASMGSIVALTSPDAGISQAPGREQLANVRTAMGDAFADRYEASLERQAEALRAQTQAAMAAWQPPPGWLKQD